MFSVFIIFFVISGIILNHRELLSGIDVNRKSLPTSYHYWAWNTAAVKGSINLNKDEKLIYGNIGLYKTDSLYSDFEYFGNGLPEGADAKKVQALFKSKKGHLLAGTYFGLYKYSFKNNKWEKIQLPIHEKRIVDFTEKGDSIYILSRSYLIKTKNFKNFEVEELPHPENYNNKVGLFKTLWVIHSGEIYGEAGRIVVDIIGLIMAFLTISGFIIFLNKIVLKKNNLKQKRKSRKKRTNRFMLKWHNKIGWTTAILLIITASTGMFLRPPFLIPIANTEVGKIPFTKLDTDNAWFDKLRRIYYDKEIDRFIISTSTAFYYSDDNFKSELKKFRVQPPASVMGVTVLKKKAKNTYLIGSFEGLFLWNPESGMIFDYVKKRQYIPPKSKGRPLGDHLVSGYISDYKNSEVFFDYNFGAYNLSGGENFTPMSKEIRDNRMSLWNLALEVHTGRYFQFLFKDFYILIVPLTALALIFIVASGFIIWYKKFR